MTRLRAAAGVARLTLRAGAASSIGGFGSVAPRPQSCAPSHCLVPLSRLSGSFRSVSVCLEELQRAWERDPSSAGHWFDAVTADHRINPVAADHRIDPVVGALHPSAGIPRQILQESIQLLFLVRSYQVSGNMMTQVDSLGYEDRPFPDRFYRSNQADIEREFFLGLSGMPGEKLSYLPLRKPKVHCHLDDRVRCDWFWKPEASGGLNPHYYIWPKVITNKPSLSNHHWKMLESDRLMRQTEGMISGNASENLEMTCDLPGNSDWLWPDFKLPGQTSHFHTRPYSVITSVGYSLDNYPPLIIWKSKCHTELHYGYDQIPVHSITYLEHFLQVIKVDENKPNLLKLNHQKLLGSDTLIRGAEKMISRYASKIMNEYLEMKNCDLPAKRDWLWPGFISPRQTLNAHGRPYSVITNVGYSLDNYPPLIIWKSKCHTELHYGYDQIPAHNITCLEHFLQVIQVDKNKPNLLKLNHRKLLGIETLIRGAEKMISGYASKIMNEYLEMKNCDLPAKRDWLWPGFKSPGQISNAHGSLSNASELKTDEFLRSVNVDLCYDYDGQGPGPNAYLEFERFLQMSNFRRRGSSTKFKWPAISSLPSLHGARFHCRRYCSTSGTPSPQKKIKIQKKYTPPTEWLVPAFEESLMKRVWPPDVSCPDYAMLVKTVPGVVPETCTDESVFLINYDPYAYVKARPLFRREVIHGSQSSISGDKPFIWLAYDHAIQLMQSLPLLARFFHEQNLCLPRLTLNDLVITGAGTFRLRGTAISYRECTPDNIRDVYNNIRTLLMELLAILKELPGDLETLFVLMKDGFQNEYLICFHAFFIPLSNKSHALLRFIDEILELPDDSKTLYYLLGSVLAYKQKWQEMATSNAYLVQWFRHREYGLSRKEFILFLRAIICHKLEHGLLDKFVDFLVFAIFPNVLKNLQRTLSDMGRLRGFHMEELYLHNARPGFVPFDDESLIEMGGSGDGTIVEIADFSYVRRLIQENKRLIDFAHGRRIWESSVLAKLKFFKAGELSELDNLIENDMLSNFVRGADKTIRDQRVVD